MKKKKTRKIIVLLFLLSLFTVLETGRLMEMGKYYGLQKKSKIQNIEGIFFRHL